MTTSDFKPMCIWLNDKKPEKLTDIIGNLGICNALDKYIKTGNLPNLLFIGDHGVGKRTIANIFAKTYLMEDYSHSVRFILTCNYPNKILPPIHSRCQHIAIPKTDHTEFTARAATVLVTEGIEFDIDTLDSYVKATYPDLRKCLNLTQQNSQTGVLLAPNANDRAVGDWKLDCVDMFKRGKVREARTLLCQQSTPEEADVTFRWMYDNLDLWSRDVEKQDQAIIIIRNGIANIPLVADQEINLSATICELARL